MREALVVVILMMLASAASAAQVYRGDYPMNGEAWNHDWLPCKNNPKQLCWRVVLTPQEMSTFNGAGAGGGGGAGAGAGAGGGAGSAGGSSW